MFKNLCDSRKLIKNFFTFNVNIEVRVYFNLLQYKILKKN